MRPFADLIERQLALFREDYADLIERHLPRFGLGLWAGGDEPPGPLRPAAMLEILDG